MLLALLRAYWRLWCVERQVSLSARKLSRRLRLKLPKSVVTTVAAPGRGEPICAVIGEFSAGKSSFLNAIVPGLMLPTGLLETTAVPTRISLGAEKRVGIRDAGGGIAWMLGDLPEEDWSTIPSGGSVVYEVPDTPFGRVTLVDTPGINTPNEEHVKIAGECARTAVAWLFLTRVDQALRKSEVDWLISIGVKEHLVVVGISQADRVSTSDLRKVERSVRQRLRQVGLSPLAIIPVSTAPDPRWILARRKLVRALVHAAAISHRFMTLRWVEARRMAVIGGFLARLQLVERKQSADVKKWEAERKRLSNIKETLWLDKACDDISSLFERSLTALVFRIHAEYAERRNRISIQPEGLYGGPPVEDASSSLRRLVSQCEAVISSACHFKPSLYAAQPIWANAERWRVAIRPQEDKSGSPVFFDVKPVPGLGIMRAIIGLFTVDQDRAADLARLRIAHADDECTRWLAYTRRRYREVEELFNHALLIAAEHESATATAALHDLAVAKKRLDGQNDLLRSVRKRFEIMGEE